MIKKECDPLLFALIDYIGNRTNEVSLKQLDKEFGTGINYDRHIDFSADPAE